MQHSMHVNVCVLWPRQAICTLTVKIPWFDVRFHLYVDIHICVRCCAYSWDDLLGALFKPEHRQPVMDVTTVAVRTLVGTLLAPESAAEAGRRCVPQRSGSRGRATMPGPEESNDIPSFIQVVRMISLWSLTYCEVCATLRWHYTTAVLNMVR